MNCGERKNQLLLYALGELDSPEASELRAHLDAGCPICEGHLAEAQALVSMIPLSLSTTPPPTGAKARLMKRVGKSSGAAASPLRIAPSSPANSRGRWLGPAVLGALAASILVGLVSWPIIGAKNHELALADKRDKDRIATINELQSQYKLTADQLHMVALTNAQMVKLDTGAQPSARGMVCWDPVSHHYFFVASGLKQLTPGTTYELWLVNDKYKMGKPMPAGVFQVNADGQVNLPIVTADMPPAANLVASAVTIEAGNGGDTPSNDKFQIVGKLQ